MVRKSLLIGAMACALGLVMIPAQAADNITFGTWYAFSFGDNNTPLGAGNEPGFSPSGVIAPDSPWTITLASPARLTVTDVEEAGDQFTFYANGILLGTTSAPTPFSTNVGECISCALADSRFSHGVFMLPAGTSNLTGTFDGIVGFGNGDFLVSSVPEPSTWAMFLMGFGSLGAFLRSKRRRASAPLAVKGPA